MLYIAYCLAKVHKPAVDKCRSLGLILAAMNTPQ